MASTFALTSPGGRSGSDPLLTSRELTVALGLAISEPVAVFSSNFRTGWFFQPKGGRAASLVGSPTSQSATGMGPSGVP